uniref:Putative secreted protein n=1 Tax=Ixodes ricinus TaxID=34613 RepID=A0A6B0UDL9_IXORI
MQLKSAHAARACSSTSVCLCTLSTCALQKHGGRHEAHAGIQAFERHPANHTLSVTTWWLDEHPAPPFECSGTACRGARRRHAITISRSAGKTEPLGTQKSQSRFM